MAVESLPETPMSAARRSRERVRLYRQKHTRIDYTPSEKALARLSELKTINPNHTVGSILDYLVLVAK